VTKGPIKNMAASVRQRLMNISKATNRRFGDVLQHYALERWLFRLAPPLVPQLGSTAVDHDHGHAVIPAAKRSVGSRLALLRKRERLVILETLLTFFDPLLAHPLRNPLAAFAADRQAGQGLKLFACLLPRTGGRFGRHHLAFHPRRAGRFHFNPQGSGLREKNRTGKQDIA